jgi:hypothetical protein
LRVTYEHDESTAFKFDGTRISGSTQGLLFKNPPSEYGTTPVKVTMFGQCKKENPKANLVTSFAELTAFSRGFIETYNAEFKTETEIIGA